MSAPPLNAHASATIAWHALSKEARAEVRRRAKQLGISRHEYLVRRIVDEAQRRAGG